MSTKHYDITPMPKPRMTQSDKWKQRPIVMKYRKFCDECNLKGMVIHSSFTVVFYMPMPKSWSIKKKKSMDGEPHRQVPDIDNLQKAILDAVCEDDSYVWHINAYKVWDYKGGDGHYLPFWDWCWAILYQVLEYFLKHHRIVVIIAPVGSYPTVANY